MTLADAGLRNCEARSLRRGDIDRLEPRALGVGKGDKPEFERICRPSLEVIDDSLKARRGAGSEKPLTSLPLFVRLDQGAGKKIPLNKAGEVRKGVMTGAKGVRFRPIG